MPVLRTKVVGETVSSYYHRYQDIQQFLFNYHSNVSKIETYLESSVVRISTTLPYYGRFDPSKLTIWLCSDLFVPPRSLTLLKCVLLHETQHLIDFYLGKSLDIIERDKITSKTTFIEYIKIPSERRAFEIELAYLRSRNWCIPKIKRFYRKCGFEIDTALDEFM
jgi:hypothetical protein